MGAFRLRGDGSRAHPVPGKAGNLGRFPNARFHIQDREMAYASGRYMGHRALRTSFAVDHVSLMVRHVYAERAVFNGGAGTIAPGVEIFCLGGPSGAAREPLPPASPA
jgi:hypothetical protein